MNEASEPLVTGYKEITCIIIAVKFLLHWVKTYTPQHNLGYDTFYLANEKRLHTIFFLDNQHISVSEMYFEHQELNPRHQEKDTHRLLLILQTRP